MVKINHIIIIASLLIVACGVSFVLLIDSIPPCPLSMTSYMSAAQDAPKGIRKSAESRAHSVVTQVVENNAATERKTIFVGDNHMRDIFANFAIITYTAGDWEDKNAYTAAIPSALSEFGIYYDARLKLKEGLELGEMFYSPTAGRIQKYDEKPQTGSLNGNEDWLESCRQRKPFSLDTYTYDAPNVVQTYSQSDNRFEKVLLGVKDNVLFNAGGHLKVYDENIRHLTELLDCMEIVRSEGKDPGWPQLFYVMSNQHYARSMKAGGVWLYNTALPASCLELDDSESFTHLTQCERYLQGKLPMVRFILNDNEESSIKNGGHEEDCSHWAKQYIVDAYTRGITASVLAARLEH